MTMPGLVTMTAAVSYLVAGINPAIVLSKLVYKKDIRDFGSGNPGFTNFKRTFGGKLAGLVMFLDLFKSILLCTLSGLLFGHFCGMFHLGAAVSTCFSILGHSFPVWYGFKGGKGFLVMAASIWFMDWRAGMISLAILCALLFTTHYMSLSTVCAVLSAPISILVFGYQSIWIPILAAACALFIAVRHHENFKRLFTGTERKFYFKSKKEA